MKNQLNGSLLRDLAAIAVTVAKQSEYKKIANII
jgi:hypothetical protein